MMAYQSNLQPKLFYYNVKLEHRIPQNHILRKIQGTIDRVEAGQVDGSKLFVDTSLI